MDNCKKIVIIGPESTGKSTLCQQLSAHYNSGWVPEFARGYLLQHGMKYSYADLLTIAKGQLALEDEILQQTPVDKPIFIDTDMYVMKVWCEFVFGQCHRWILHTIAIRPYDLYLLCNTDLLWVKDELREYPDLESRERLFAMYKDVLVNQQVPWTLIDGNNEQRLQKAIAAVDGLQA
jgi:NadR type nicotinamide-nucleotide adenylyltransferase